MPQCPLCYPYRKQTKPKDRPDYDYSWGHHWYKCEHQDGRRNPRFAITQQHKSTSAGLNWSEWHWLGHEIWTMLPPLSADNNYSNRFKNLIVQIQFQDGHYVAKVLEYQE